MWEGPAYLQTEEPIDPQLEVLDDPQWEEPFDPQWEETVDPKWEWQAYPQWALPVDAQRKSTDNAWMIIQVLLMKVVAIIPERLFYKFLEISMSK